MPCILEIGDRVVLRSEGGPPEAEYALFDAGEIELQATEPGIVREVGYRSTAADAIRRMEQSGITLPLALDAGVAMIPGLAVAYARGPAVRRVAPLLGASELFEGGAYDAELRRYEGAWLDLPALALDSEISRASTLLQALHLMALLHEVPPSATVLLSTREHAMDRRPGERSYRRVPLDNAASVPEALRTLAARIHARPKERDDGPGRAAVLEALRARASVSPDPQAQDRFAAIEAAMAIRERPSRGPLADPELWLLEEQLSAGNASGVIERIDDIERKRGRHPATAYLRSRASLLTGRDSPAAIAERAGALAMSMSSFNELELLAAEAWAAAGQLRRAAPFARDLMEDPSSHEELRARALHVLEAADRAGQLGSVPPPPPKPQSKISTLPPPPRPSNLPPATRASLMPPMDLTLDPPQRGEDEAMIGPAPVTPLDSDLTMKAQSPSTVPPPRRHPQLGHSSAPPRPTAPLPMPAGSRAPWTDEPPVEAVIPTAPRTGFRTNLTPKEMPSRAIAGAGQVAWPMTRTVPGVAPPDDPSPQRLPHVSAWPVAAVEEKTPPSGPAPAPAPSLAPGRPSTEFMRGASQPPYRFDSPTAHAHIPRPPSSPPPGPLAEAAEHLSMPQGLSGPARPIDFVPATVLDARVHFTYLARELGREYRLQHSIELRADVSGIEAVQAQLLERYPTGNVHTLEDALDVRRHGAFLSETVARGLGGFWVDIAPSDFGYWAMVVPPETRVWPFGRVLRFITRGHKERDLVSYYLELRTRVR